MIAPVPSFSTHSMPASPAEASAPLLSYRTIAPSGAPLGEDELRPFRCLEPGCFLRFKRKFALAEHTKTHTGEKPFVCPVRSCGKAFSTTGNLSRHKRLHPWLKPQVCLVAGCGRSFSNETKLERHLMTHFEGPQIILPCEVAGCESMFSTMGNLTRHLKQQHYGYHFQRQELTFFDSPASVESEHNQNLSVGMLSGLPENQPAKAFNPLMGEESCVSDDELREFLDGVFEVEDSETT